MSAVVFKELKYLGLDTELSSEITPENLELLLDENPYIELINQPETASIKKKPTPINKGDLGNPAVMETDCGWVVHYYPPTDNSPARIKASRPVTVSSNIEPELASLSTEHQTMRTAVELYKILSDQGWDKFKVVDGTPRFIWSTWVVLNYNKSKLTGFSPKDFHKHIFEQVKDTIMETMHKEISGQAAIKEETGVEMAEDADPLEGIEPVSETGEGGMDVMFKLDLEEDAENSKKATSKGKKRKK